MCDYVANGEFIYANLSDWEALPYPKVVYPQWTNELELFL